MLFKLIHIELIKTKRSLALLMMFLSPLMVLLVNVLLLINTQGKFVESKGWGMFWLQNYSMWGYFMLPLYIALITALLNGIEHRSNGWRLMLALPIRQNQLFFAKLVLAWLYLVGASIVLYLSILIAILFFELFGYSASNILSFDASIKLLYTLISCLGILTIQHIVSWRWQNIVAPLGLGVVATMSIMQFSHSQYWHFNPWTYTLMTTNASDQSMQDLALIYSISITMLLLAIASFWLCRREVTS